MSVQQAEIQSEKMAANEMHARQETFLRVSQRVQAQLGTIAGFCTSRAKAADADGTVSPEEQSRLFGQLSQGDPEVFSRRMLETSFRLANDHDRYRLFYGTPVRARHIEQLHLYIRATDCARQGSGSGRHDLRCTLFDVARPRLQHGEAFSGHGSAGTGRSRHAPAPISSSDVDGSSMRAIGVTCLIVWLTAALSLANAAEPDRFADVSVKSILVGGSVYMLTGAGGNMAVSIGKDGTLLVDDQFPALAAANPDRDLGTRRSRAEDHPEYALSRRSRRRQRLFRRARRDHCERTGALSTAERSGTAARRRYRSSRTPTGSASSSTTTKST